MPKNKIQRQKGLSLQQFQKTYGTEEGCRSRLFKVRWPQGYRCPKCNCNHYYTVTTRNLSQCTNCKTSLSSGV
jgi:transposase-like zinc ribbon protein